MTVEPVAINYARLPISPEVSASVSCAMARSSTALQRQDYQRVHKPMMDHNGIEWPNAAAATWARGYADRTGYSRAESGYMGWRFGEPGEI